MPRLWVHLTFAGNVAMALTACAVPAPVQQVSHAAPAASAPAVRKHKPQHAKLAIPPLPSPPLPGSTEKPDCSAARSAGLSDARKETLFQQFSDMQPTTPVPVQADDLRLPSAVSRPDAVGACAAPN
jgi:hypothetical protein